MTESTIQVLIDEALTAFWEVVVRHYPQAETGDLSPWATIKLTLAAENAVEEWIDNNVRSSDADHQLSGGDHEQ
jgi:hypothetical protein